MSAIARKRMKNWEIIADNLSKTGWMGCVSAIDSNGRTIWIVDAHRDDGKRFVVRADEKLSAFMELEAGAVRPLPAGTAGPLEAEKRGREIIRKERFTPGNPLSLTFGGHFKSARIPSHAASC